MRALKVLAIGAVVFGLWAQPAAHAANPESGSITKKKRSVSWMGGPMYMSEPSPGGDCLGGSEDPACDYFALTVTLGEGAKVQVKVTTSRANAQDGVNGVQGDDYDLYVYAPNGALVGEAANDPRGNETAEFRHRSQYNGRPYEVRIAPWLVLPGSTYKGTASALTLGR